MTTTSHQSIGVHVRWRPLAEFEAPVGEVNRVTSWESSRSLSSISIDAQASSNKRQWSSQVAFENVFDKEDDNATVFQNIVLPSLSRVLKGASCSYFAYGHTGSGKTHTVIGYDYEKQAQLGLCLAAGKQLFRALAGVNKDKADEEKLGIGLSLFELRKNSAFDLLNGRTECHIRQGHDGKTHIRGPTEMLENGKVRVRPIMQRPCWTYEELCKELQHSLSLRTVGTSSIHQLSSRTHAILKLEIISARLFGARQELFDRESELVPVGKRATDIIIEERTKGVIIKPGGGWEPNPDYTPDQERIDIANAEQEMFESRVAAAEKKVFDILNSEDSPECIGGRLVFVDLAGAEYQQDAASTGPKQTAQERQEGRQINTDLLALKEVIRASALRKARIPFRSSPLTMVLREHFLGSKDGVSAMIVNVSPAQDQFSATLNSLRYGGLVGVRSA